MVPLPKATALPPKPQATENPESPTNPEQVPPGPGEPSQGLTPGRGIQLPGDNSTLPGNGIELPGLGVPLPGMNTQPQDGAAPPPENATQPPNSGTQLPKPNGRAPAKQTPATAPAPTVPQKPAETTPFVPEKPAAPAPSAPAPSAPTPAEPTPLPPAKTTSENSLPALPPETATATVAAKPEAAAPVMLANKATEQSAAAPPQAMPDIDDVPPFEASTSASPAAPMPTDSSAAPLPHCAQRPEDSVREPNGESSSDRRAINVSYSEPVGAQPRADLPPEVSAANQSPVANVNPQPQPQPPTPVQPADAPVALQGYCPVELTDHEHWVQGDARWTAVYAGRTFLLSGADQQQQFLANPARYVPACGGDDPVVALQGGGHVPGKAEFSIICDGKVYLFSSDETLTRFRANPERYSEAAR